MTLVSGTEKRCVRRVQYAADVLASQECPTSCDDTGQARYYRGRYVGVRLQDEHQANTDEKQEALCHSCDGAHRHPRGAGPSRSPGDQNEWKNDDDAKQHGEKHRFVDKHSDPEPCDDTNDSH